MEPVESSYIDEGGGADGGDGVVGLVSPTDNPITMPITTTTTNAKKTEDHLLRPFDLESV